MKTTVNGLTQAPGGNGNGSGSGTNGNISVLIAGITGVGLSAAPAPAVPAAASTPGSWPRRSPAQSPPSCNRSWGQS